MIVKIVGTAILSLAVILFLRTIDRTLAIIVGVGCGVVILGMNLLQMESFVSYYYELCADHGYGEYFSVMLKGLGIALLTQTGADICKDSGENGLSSVIEFAGKAEILLVCLPLVKSLMSLSESILAK